jgi:hypothetical protein
MLFAWIGNALGLALGAFFGLRGLIDPRWAARLMRLEERALSNAELRTLFGGVALGLHAAALYLTLGYLRGGALIPGVMAAGASFALAAGWGGAALGRFASIMRDPGADTAFNRLAAGVAVAMAAAIGAPWALWLGGLEM